MSEKGSGIKPEAISTFKEWALHNTQATHIQEEFLDKIGLPYWKAVQIWEKMGRGVLLMKFKGREKEMKAELFELKDISPQLEVGQIKELEHVLYMAKETKNIQGIKVGTPKRRIAVFPSGKMYFMDWDEET